MSMGFRLCATCTVLSLALAPALGASPLTVSNLRCEFLENPLGIDDAAPRLS